MIVLASGSPRRGYILTNAGIAYTREIPGDIDETPAPDEPPRQYDRGQCGHSQPNVPAVSRP